MFLKGFVPAAAWNCSVWFGAAHSWLSSTLLFYPSVVESQQAFAQSFDPDVINFFFYYTYKHVAHPAFALNEKTTLECLDNKGKGKVPILREIELELSYVVFSSPGTECEIQRMMIQNQPWSSPASLGEHVILEKFPEYSNAESSDGIKGSSLPR